MNKKNMYIGNRYTPVIDGVWNITKQYEAMTIVTWMGASYTSKKFVPKGVSINNETYWALTGNYNYQVEIYRKEIKQYKKDTDGKICELDNKVDSVNKILIKLEEKHNKDIKDINLLISKMPIKTPEDFGCVGDGITDDSINFLKAMNECANNSFILSVNKKYRIAKTIKYKGWNSLMIIGSKPNSNSLVVEELPPTEVHANIVFTDNAALELNKMGSVTFFGVSLASTSINSGRGILLRSFHNKFLNCSFTQFKNAIIADKGWTNWLGENQILYSGFYNCDVCYEATEGSDSEFIGNLIHGTCNVGFKGQCAGYTIALNHFYGRKPNIFNFFNTKIINNYIQEYLSGEPSIILDGSFGCMVHDNNFELSADTPRDSIKGLIGLKLNNGMGNISFDGNSVHGKSLVRVKNLAFIDLIYSDSRYDMPITWGVNNLKCCEAMFTKYYPMYNINGILSLPSLDVTVLGGVVAEQKTEVVNGICFFYVKMTQLPNYADCLRLANFGTIPVAYNMKKTPKSGQVTYHAYTTVNGTISVGDYEYIKEIEVSGSYPISHQVYAKYYIS